MNSRITLAIVSAFLLMCCMGCKFSRQAQKSSTATTSSTATDSTATNLSKTDKSTTDEWSSETETQYGQAQQHDSAGNVYNYYYPTKIIERKAGRTQRNDITTDSSHLQVKKATADSTGTMASVVKAKASGFNQVWILLMVAGGAAILLGGKWAKNNFTVSRKTIL